MVLTPGGNLPTILNEIARREASQASLKERLTRLTLAADVPWIDRQSLERQIRDRLKNYSGLFARHVTQSPQIVSKLIPGRIVVTPSEAGYQYEGVSRITPIIAGNRHRARGKVVGDAGGAVGMAGTHVHE